MRWFNTAGPCNPDWHYMVPAERRLPEASKLVARHGYFVVHAPRQTGKTTTLRALARQWTASGDYAALHFSVEAAKVTGDDFGAAERIVLGTIETSAGSGLPPDLRPPESWLESASPGERIQAALTSWARACPRLLVLIFDEIDALTGQSLLSVLGQLRAGYASRPEAFPASVVLCGLRDVRDYKAASGGDPTWLGTSSPFNIKLASLCIGDFTEVEMRELYAQHTAETGQPFEEAALQRAWELSVGQPWLVNAIAQRVVDDIVPAPAPVTAAHVDDAKERLILARETHLDSLVARLMEPRVRAVIEPLIAGTYGVTIDAYDDAVGYVRDLGLVTRRGQVAIANPIYREVIVRVLSQMAEDQLPVDDPRAFVVADGRLDLRRLLEEFAAFWREHGEVLAGHMPYHEVAPQLVLMAYLQRVVNGGGAIDREYGVGRGRIDLLVRWPYADAGGKRRWQREALELKAWADGRPDPLDKGLAQLDGYLERLGLDTGVLVVFDRREDAPPPAERTAFDTARSPAGRTITLLRA